MSRFLFACTLGATATAINANGATEPAATEGSTVPYAYPAMDPTKTLTGKALVDALRRGGNVLFMRHTETGTVTAECLASNLTPRGERDAARVGKALQMLGIQLERIATSPVCRAQDTARNLGLGTFAVVEDLSNVTTRPDFDLHAARSKLLATMPGPGKNVLLVSHMQSGNNSADMIYLDFGEIIVFVPDGTGGRAALARVRVDDWGSQFQKNKNDLGVR